MASKSSTRSNIEFGTGEALGRKEVVTVQVSNLLCQKFTASENSVARLVLVFIWICSPYSPAIFLHLFRIFLG
jgi:hypothetical protein